MDKIETSRPKSILKENGLDNTLLFWVKPKKIKRENKKSPTSIDQTIT
jgi:hypothetical protein